MISRVVAPTGHTLVTNRPGAPSRGTRVHTMADALATSTAATRATACSCSRSSISRAQLRSSNPMASGEIVRYPRLASSAAYAWSGSPRNPTTSLLPRSNWLACWWWQKMMGTRCVAPSGMHTKAEARPLGTS